MMGGWVKAYRSARKHKMLHSAVRKGLWFDLLLMAAHEPTRIIMRGRTVDLQPGQCAVVIADWAKENSLTPRQVERIVDSFVLENAVSKSYAPGKAFTIITLCNYEKYQSRPEDRGGRAVEPAGQARWKGGGREQESEEPEEDKKDSSPTETLSEPSAPTLFPNERAPLTRKDRWPPKTKLPKSGGKPVYPPEFEAAWSAYAVRPEDTKGDCYAHWQRAVVQDRVAPDVIAQSAEAWAFLWARREMRIGFRRWLREAMWNQPPPKPNGAGQRQSIAEQVREANERDRRGEAWDPFGDIEESAYATGPEIEHRTLPEMPSDDADGRPQDAAHGRGRHQGPDRALRTNVVPLLARGG